MKKSLIGIMLMALMLSACSSDDAANKKEGNSDATKIETKENDRAAGVDKGLLNVEVTIPKDFFEEDELEEVVANAEAEGIKDVKINDDGSVTYKMTKGQHKEMMKEMKANLIEYVDELITDETFSSIYDVTHNKDFSAYQIIVDKEVFENSFDGFAVLGLGMSGMLYQLYDGVNPEKLNVKIDTIDESSGELIGSMNYPEDLEDME